MADETKIGGTPNIFHVAGSDVRRVTGAPNLVLRGVIIPDDPRVIAAPLRKAMVEGWYENAEADELKGLIDKGERILELGSAIGYISTLMSRDPGTEEILCFEANPQLIEFCRNVHRLNDVRNVRIENAILTTDDSLREIKFYLREHFWTSSTYAGPRGYQSEAMIRATSLARVIADFRPTMIVCDIEGGEVDLFEHADLASIQKIMLELHPEVTGLPRIGTLFDAMSRNGLIYDLDHSRRKIVTFRRPRDQAGCGKAS